MVMIEKDKMMVMTVKSKKDKQWVKTNNKEMVKRGSIKAWVRMRYGWIHK